MYKYSVLMYNFNNYEIMREPREIDPECEYIYVTDNPDLQKQTKVWKIVVDKDLDGLSVFDKCYKVRFNLFKYCSTDTCIYLDGSVQIYKSLRKFYNDFMASGNELGLIIHPLRFSIPREYEIWKQFRRYPEKQAEKCMKAMQAMGYDLNYKGLYEMTVRIVKNTPRNKLIDESCYNLLKKLGTKDCIERLDQTAYSCLMNLAFSDTKVFPMSEQIIHSDYMKWCIHGKEKINPILANTDVRNEGFLFDKLVTLYKLFEYDLSGLSKTDKIKDAIISMTSWKKRIGTVSLSIYSLIKQCPQFDIVLTLSEEEFPQKEKELPTDLMKLVNEGYVEILWVKENYKSLKKVLYTMEKYSDKAIISADDDCVYTCNYAKELYDLWKKNPNKICTINAKQPTHTAGPSTLYYPKCFGETPIKEMKANTHLDVYMNADDAYYEVLRDRYKCKIAYLSPKKIWFSHDTVEPLGNIYNKPGYITWMRNNIQAQDAGHKLDL